MENIQSMHHIDCHGVAALTWTVTVWQQQSKLSSRAWFQSMAPLQGKEHAFSGKPLKPIRGFPGNPRKQAGGSLGTPWDNQGPSTWSRKSNTRICRLHLLLLACLMGDLSCGRRGKGSAGEDSRHIALSEDGTPLFFRQKLGHSDRREMSTPLLDGDGNELLPGLARKARQLLLIFQFVSASAGTRATSTTAP